MNVKDDTKIITVLIVAKQYRSYYIERVE